MQISNEARQNVVSYCKAVDMDTLKKLCAGLPIDPLPDKRIRDPSIAHAPVRNHQLTEAEQKVRHLLSIYSQINSSQVIEYSKVIRFVTKQVF